MNPLAIPADSHLVDVFANPPFVFTWPIDFARMKNVGRDHLESAEYQSCFCTYSAELFYDVRTTYGAHHCREVGPMDGRALVFLNGCLNVPTCLYVHYKFSILNANGDRSNIQEGRQRLPAYPIAQLSVDFLSLHNKSGDLTLCFEIYELDTPNIAAGFSGDNLIGLSNDQHALFECGKFADVVLVVSGQQFKAHKAILSARSPVFEGMLERIKLDQVVIPDLAADVVQELLRFIYTGRAFRMDVLAEDLLPAADKYQVKTLKLHCEKYLSSTLTADSVSRIMLLAKHHKALYLYESCAKFCEINFPQRGIKRKVLM